jgi:hypothetical protein
MYYYTLQINWVSLTTTKQHSDKPVRWSVYGPGVLTVFAFAAVWSATYWVLATKYDAYAVLWGCLVDADATQRKFKSHSLLGASQASRRFVTALMKM